MRGNYVLTNAFDGLAEVLVTIPTKNGFVLRATKIIFISGAFAPALFTNESLDYVKNESYQLPAQGTKILSSPTGNITFNFKSLQKIKSEGDSLILNKNGMVDIKVIYYDKATLNPLGQFTVHANPNGITAFNSNETIPTEEGSSYFYQAFAYTKNGKLMFFLGEALSVTTSLKNESFGATAHLFLNGKKPTELAL